MIAADVQNIKASWLSDIPSHWNVVRLKTIVKGGTNGVWGSEPKNNKNDIICVRVADIDEWQYGISQSDLTRRNISDTDQSSRLLNFGDLIIEKSGGGEISPVGRVVIFNLNEKAVTSNFMARLNVIGDINKEFLYYYFRFLYHRRLNHPAIKATTGIQNLDLYAYLQNPIPIPTPKEQTEIVGFINHTSGEITRFIQTKQRFIELLKEQRQSIITNAVTKGIDENVKMKETGIDWMPEVPEHWILKRGNWVYDLGKEIITKEQLLSVKELLHYSIPSIQDTGRPAVESGDTIDSNKQIVKPGDLLVSKLNPRKKTIVIVENDSENRLLVASTEFVNLRCKDVNIDYAFYLYQSHLVTERISSTVQSSTNSHQRSYPDTIYKMWNYYPPTIEEQKQIVEHIKTETRTLDIAISKAEREIELIKEYREAMIAEAVTGKMKL